MGLAPRCYGQSSWISGSLMESCLRNIASLGPDFVDFRRLVMGGKALPEDAITVGIGGEGLCIVIFPTQMAQGSRRTG
jgi:hypothetical protein